METNNIHPIFDTILQREEKEILLEQKGIVIWMVGLSGSGKSTIAKIIERSLYSEGYITQLLDGDNLRTGINNNLSFSEQDRVENIRRAAEIAKLFLHCGVITICSFISPTQSIRSMAKSIIGEADYCEVYINCPIEVCEQRDVKGLYKKARNGEILNFTGINALFEAPSFPDIEVNTSENGLEYCKNEILQEVFKRINR